MSIKNIFFDFDGVLADSVNVKTQAFYDLYLPFGKEIADQVVSHHKANGGVSRFEKFKIYHREFLNKEIGEKKVENLASQFSNMVIKGVVNAPEVPGANEFLKKYYSNCNFWIITGTPTKEMEKIAEKRRIISFFKEICGSPTKKFEWTEYLINKYQLNPNETIFLGDAKSDFKAAKASGLRFALREYDENRDLFNSYQGIRFSDFKDLVNQINLN